MDNDKERAANHESRTPWRGWSPRLLRHGGGVLLRRAVSHCIIRVGGSSVEGGQKVRSSCV